MKALVLLVGLALATPLAAQTPAPPGSDVAASKGLDQCIKHISAAQSGKIEKANAKELAANGLTYRLEPPALLEQTRSTPYGQAEYAEAASADGSVWVVGYASGVCQVIVSEAVVAPVETKLKEVLTSSNWRVDATPRADKGERKAAYTKTMDRSLRLSALMSMRDEQGFTMVTINRMGR